MRTRLLAAVLVALGVIMAQPAWAHRRHVSHPHVRLGVGLGWGGWGGWWYGNPWYYGPGWYPPVAVSGEAMDVAVVDTDVSPEHARVFLNGDLIGTADNFDGYPSYLFLKPGRYTLEFRLPGYVSQSLEVEAAEGRFFPVDLELKRNPAEAEAPWYDRPQGLPVGRVFGPGKVEGKAEPAAPDVSLRPELRQPETPREAPAAKLGAALELRVSPANASVYLDGEFIGTAEELSRLQRGVAVAPGSHRVEAMAPGRAPRAVTVDVPQGDSLQVVIELETGTGQSS